MLRLLVFGATGRMGRRVCALAREAADLSVIGELSSRDEGRADAALRDADAAIDFSVPAASAAHAARAARARVPIVIGTTGLSPAQSARLRAAARRVAVLYAPNMSPGMNLLFELARRAAAALPEFDAAVGEVHHAAKKDAPSGSALRLAESIRAARGPKAPVQVVSLRAGDIVGDHTVLLAGPGERLELSHRAHSRDVFARGALRAARWLAGRRPGLYALKDALGL